MRTIIAALLLFSAAALAAEPEVTLQSPRIDPTDVVSLQRGAKTFVNYCLNCHSAAYMRYNRLTELGLSEEQIRDNLMFTAPKVGDTMDVALRKQDGKVWFGVAPPDLTVVARSRGADWLYTYLRAFYRDETRSTGWNNIVFPNVAMPHALWQLQGMQKLETTTREQGGYKEQHATLVLETPGTMKPREYDALVRDLVNFLIYMGEPAQVTRMQTGIVVLFFLAALFMLTWLLKRAYWKDVH